MGKDKFKSFLQWASRNALGNKLSLALVCATLTSVVITYILLTNAPPLLRDTKLLFFFIYLDLVLLLSLAGVVGYRLVRLWLQNKEGKAGSKLHIRMVKVFSLLAIAPTIFMAVFSTLFFQMGVQSWFNERVESAIDESLVVAKAYMGEHQKVISANARAMALELAPLFHISSLSPHQLSREQLDEVLTEEVALRSLTEAIVFDRNMDILGRSKFAFSMDFEAIQAQDLDRSKNTVIIYTSDDNSRVRALVQIDPQRGIFLLVGRYISSEVLSRVQHTEQIVGQYKLLSAEESHLAITFSMIFIGVALMLLLAAIWGALHFANKLANPMGQLIDGAEEVQKGNLNVQIPESKDSQELESLIHAFNRMTTQLRSQRSDLINANDQLDKRRRFTEAVLSGVSAGVIGLDENGAINLPNQSASDLLETDLEQHLGEDLSNIIPEFQEIFAQLGDTEKGIAEGELTISRNGHSRTLLAKLAADQFEGGVQGYVLTFDDITELQAAQRQAAWSDVARRIAHEIKNPLTPIQLSAERLKRRYLPEVKSDPGTFQSCIDTIVRQVEHIGSMVSEFASFARMPDPEMQTVDLIGVCKNAVFLETQSFSNISFEFNSARKKVPFICDAGQIEQALINILKNAAEAIQANKNQPNGTISLTLEDNEDSIAIVVDDNGIGLPKEGRERLSEPYVTHREKGTGLGLAIVKRIVEDHNGYINLSESHLGGARISLVFHQNPARQRQAS